MAGKHIQFVKAIQEGLAAQDISARQLALKIGVDRSYVTRMLHGERNPPSDALIRKIAKALDLNLERLRWYADRLPVFMRTEQPLTDQDLDEYKKLVEQIQRRRRKGKRQ